MSVFIEMWKIKKLKIKHAAIDYKQENMATASIFTLFWAKSHE